MLSNDQSQSLTNAQRDAYAVARSVARENGAKLELVADEFGVLLIETASIKWDHEQTTWTLNADGTLTIH